MGTLTIHEQEERRQEYEKGVRYATKDHPLTDPEAAYLAELLLECAGESNVTITRAEALHQLNIIVNFLESTSRISPHERKELMTRGRSNCRKGEDE